MDGEINGKQFHRWSLVAIAAANAVDTVSSWHHPEANPILGNSGFGVRSVALKEGLVGSSLLLERWALKHNPGLYRRLAWMNVAIAGGLGEVAVHNARLR